MALKKGAHGRGYAIPDVTEVQPSTLICLDVNMKIALDLDAL